MEYKNRYVVFSDSSRCPAQFLKTFVFAEPSRPHGPRVFWQTREVILALGLSLKKPPHRWFKEHGKIPDWPNVASAFRAAEEDLRPSRKAAQQEQDISALQDEQTMSTTTLLLHLLHWSQALRGTRKSNAALCLQSLLTEIFQGSGNSWPAAWSCSQIAASCPSPIRGEDGMVCRHVQNLVQERKAGVSIADAGGFLQEAWSHRESCRDSQAWLSDLLQHVRLACDELFVGPNCPFRDTAENLQALRGPCRRRRLDQDLLVKGAFGMVKTKRFRSSAAAARSGNLDVAASSAGDGEMRTMATYVEAVRANVADAAQLTLSFDESTVAGEATLLGIVFSHDKQKGMHMPLQAGVVKLGDRQRHVAETLFELGSAVYRMYDPEPVCSTSLVLLHPKPQIRTKKA